MIDYSLIWESIPSLLRGTLVALEITGVAAFMGIILGTLIGIAECSQNRLLRFIIGAYVGLFRGTPMLVQILFVYYVLPQVGIMIASFWAASLAIGLNSAAYISQTVRAGIQAVPSGQVEAAKTLGFTRTGILWYIVLPQAFRIITPTLCNELVTLLKDSSLASIVGVMELSKEASIIRSRTYDAFSILLAVSIIYLILTTVLTYVLSKWERREKYV